MEAVKPLMPGHLYNFTCDLTKTNVATGTWVVSGNYARPAK